jgi:rSAM/selenodomain-associated transferase 2
VNAGPNSISVIIPALNEAGTISGTLAAVRACLPHAEIVVVDGGSRDATPVLAVQAGARLLRSARGRGQQCALGAKQAHGAVLFFLHADTRPPADAAPVLARAFSRSELLLGTFRLAFDEPGVALQVSAWFTRFDTVFTRFGDQGIVVRRTFYEQVGGFPPWPLFEDVEFLRRARRLTRVWSFPAAVTTSARRFRQRGVLRQQWQNARLLLRFLAGASPERLAEEYRRPAPRGRNAAADVQGPS